MFSTEREGAATHFYLYCRRLKDTLCRRQALKTALKEESARAWSDFPVVGAQLALCQYKGGQKLVPCGCRPLCPHWHLENACAVVPYAMRRESVKPRDLCLSSVVHCLFHLGQDTLSSFFFSICEMKIIMTGLSISHGCFEE